MNYSETRTLCGYSSFRDESYSSHDKNIGFGLYCVYGGARGEPGQAFAVLCLCLVSLMPMQTLHLMRKNKDKFLGLVSAFSTSATQQRSKHFSATLKTLTKLSQSHWSLSHFGNRSKKFNLVSKLSKFICCTICIRFAFFL